MSAVPLLLLGGAAVLLLGGKKKKKKSGNEKPTHSGAIIEEGSVSNHAAPHGLKPVGYRIHELIENSSGDTKHKLMFQLKSGGFFTGELNGSWIRLYNASNLDTFRNILSEIDSGSMYVDGDGVVEKV